MPKKSQVLKRTGKSQKQAKVAPYSKHQFQHASTDTKNMSPKHPRNLMHKRHGHSSRLEVGSMNLPFASIANPLQIDMLVVPLRCYPTVGASKCACVPFNNRRDE
eukprot:2803986-Amphidinium_carterae.1